jgi:hypothetical protein
MSIANFGIGETIAALKAKCAFARDTTLPGESDEYPAVTFPFAGATVLAVQFTDSLKASQPADLWVLEGDSVYLPGGIRLKTTWRSLRETYGRARGWPSTGLDTADFSFCSIPGIVFRVAVAAAQDSLADPAHPETFPAEATVVRVMVERVPGQNTCM